MEKPPRRHRKASDPAIAVGAAKIAQRAIVGHDGSAVVETIESGFLGRTSDAQADH
jgi:hypothetical protein